MARVSAPAIHTRNANNKSGVRGMQRPNSAMDRGWWHCRMCGELPMPAPSPGLGRTARKLSRARTDRVTAPPPRFTRTPPHPRPPWQAPTSIITRTVPGVLRVVLPSISTGQHHVRARAQYQEDKEGQGSCRQVAQQASAIFVRIHFSYCRLAAASLCAAPASSGPAAGDDVAAPRSGRLLLAAQPLDLRVAKHTSQSDGRACSDAESEGGMHGGSDGGWHGG